MKPSRTALLVPAHFHGRRLHAATLVMCLCASHLASAASQIWSATPTDSTWATTTNWAAVAVPGLATGAITNDVATFNAALSGGIGGSANPITPDATRSIGGITFDGVSAGSFQIGTAAGVSLILSTIATTPGTHLVQVNAAVTSAQVVAAPLKFVQPSSTNGFYGFASNASSPAATLTIAGTITAGASAGRPVNLVLSGTHVGANTLGGVITSTTTGQSAALLTKSGAGRWDLTANNVFTATKNGTFSSNGSIIVSAGNLNLTGNNTFAGSDSLSNFNFTVNGGTATLSGANAFTGLYTTTLNAANGILINNTGVLVAENNNALGATAGSVNNYINSGGILELNSSSANGSITLSGNLTLQLASGGTIRSNGSNATASIIKLANGAAVSATLATVAAADVFTVGDGANDFTGGASDTVTHIAGAGTILLGQASNYAGTVAVDAGTLRLGNATALGPAASAGIAFGAGSSGKVWLDGNSVTVASLNTHATVGTPVIENNNSSGATLTVSSASGTSSYGGVLQNGAAGTLGLTKSGAGTLLLSGINTYSGATAVNGGTLGGTGTLASTVTVASAATIAPGNGGIGTLTVGGLTLNAGALLAYDVSSTSSHDQLTVTTSGALTLNGGALTLNGGASFSTNGVYNLIAYSGAIGGSGVGALTLTNSPVPGKTYTFGSAGGFVTLTVADSAAVVNYWNIDGDGSWGTGADWAVGAAPNGAGALAALGGGGTAISAPRTITLSAAYTVGTLSFYNASSAYTLVDGGSGLLTLDGGSASAAVTDAAGSHVVAVPLVTNSYGVTFSAVGATDTLSATGVVSGAGKLTKTGNGMLVLSGSNTYLGGTAITLGTVAVNSSTSLGDVSGAVAIGAGTLQATANITSTRAYQLGDATSTLAVDAGMTLALGGVIADGAFPGTLNKTGTGTLTLTGTNTFSGGTLVGAGTLNINADAALGAAATLTLNGGSKLQAGAPFTLAASRGVVLGVGSVVVDSSSYALTVAGAVSGSGTLDKTGSGTLTLSGANTHASTIVDAGTLVVGNNAALGSGPVTLNGSGALNLGARYMGNDLIVNGSGNVLTSGDGGGVSAINKLTGAGVLDLYINAGNVDFRADMTGFSGTITYLNQGNIRLYNSWGSAAASFDLGSGSGSLNKRTTSAGTIALGALSGGASTYLSGASGSGNATATTYAIGGNGASTTFAGTIANGGGTTSITKTGAGILTLTGVNTFSGALTVNAGILQPRAQSLGAGSIAVTGGRIELGWFDTISATYTSANAVTLNGGGLFAWDAYQHLSGNLAIGASGGTLGSTFNNAGADTNKGLFIDGVLSGSAAVTVQQTYGGSNAWETSIVFLTNNANTYSGTLSVNPNSGGGVYVGLDAPSALAGATLNLTGGPGGAKQFGDSQLVFTTNLGGAASLGALAGSGNVVLTEYDASAHAVAATPLALSVGNNNTSTTYSGVLSGGGSLTKTGSGTLTLSGVNTYSGDTTVTAGILAVNGTALPDAGKLVISGGQVQPTGTETVATLYFGAAQQIAGTWGASGSGATNINDSYFAGSAGVVLVSSGPAAANFTSWAAAHGVSGGLTGDSNHNGISNAVEYALNLDYAGSTASAGSFSGRTLSFAKRAEAVANGDVTYAIEVSTNMLAWTAVTPDVNDATTISYTLPAGQAKEFARLNVTIATP